MKLSYLAPILLAILGIALLAFRPFAPHISPSFQSGEFLKYRIHYGFVTAGYATLEVMPEQAILQDRPCWHIVGKGFTHPGFDWVYKVRDQYETFVDTESLLSRRFNRHIREGGFESYTETYFDQEQHKASYINEWKKVTEYPVPPGIQDVISAFYHARSTHNAYTMQVGDEISLRNFLDRKTFDLKARLLKRETIKVDGHAFRALKFALMIEEAGLITDGSKINFWISEDENKVPLRIQSELKIGSLKADLMEWQNLSHPFDAKVEEE
ncbi:MAG: DUF3108 domain-containing protein [Bacteroidota bacterium]